MSNIIHVNFPNTTGTKINTAQVVASRRTLPPSLLQQTTAHVEIELATEHASDPIKEIDDINRVSRYLIDQKRYRDNMLFILGINFGLRVSDLVKLRFCQLIDEHNAFRTTFPVLEQKTSNTRKVKKNRYITINDAVMDAVTLYLLHAPRACGMDDYLFRSNSNRGSNQNTPLSRMSVDRILKGIASELELPGKIATHSLRKTFGYHQMVMSGNDPRKLLLLQKIFGHSSAAQTLDYIGITREEIGEAYAQLNLGHKACYATFSNLLDKEDIG